MRVLSLFLVLFLTGNFFAQRVQNINLYPTSTSVVIKFSISAGSSCSGYTILHSLDSLTYTEAGNEPGICGSTSGSEDKSFTHLNPVFGQINYYRVRLEPYVETSFSRGIYVASTDNSVKIVSYPNPVSSSDNSFTLKIFNLENTKLTGHIYNHVGKSVQSLDLFVTRELASVSPAGMSPGLYLLRLTDGHQFFITKFVVLN